MKLPRVLTIGFLIVSLSIAVVSVIQVTPYIATLRTTYAGTPVPTSKESDRTMSVNDFIAFIAKNSEAKSVAVTSEDGVTEIPPEISQLSRLESMLIDTVAIAALPPEIGSLAELKSLTIRKTQITTLPSTIGNLQSLTELDLSFNKLNTLPEEIGLLSSLTTLKLNNNELTQLPASVGNLKELTSLDLRGNRISELPDTITDLKKLHFLYLGGNAFSPSYYQTLKKLLPQTAIY